MISILKHSSFLSSSRNVACVCIFIENFDSTSGKSGSRLEVETRERLRDLGRDPNASNQQLIVDTCVVEEDYLMAFTPATRLRIGVVP